MNADEILFRCSSLGHLMTEPRVKSETISEGTKTHLIDVYVAAVYGRKQDITTKYMEKGLMVEEDSITLFNRVFRKEYPDFVFSKNEERISNEFVSGTPDIYTGLSLLNTEEVIDVKSSWDIFTFFRNKHKEMYKLYYWQLLGYMWLTGAKSARLAYCLVNTPATMIEDEKRKLAWKMGTIDSDANPDYIEACKEIDRLSIYDDIPIAERVHVIQVARNESDIERLQFRIVECREWMNKNLFR